MVKEKDFLTLEEITEALAFFNLKPNFQEEELREAYVKFMQVNHPDISQDSSASRKASLANKYYRRLKNLNKEYINPYELSEVKFSFEELLEKLKKENANNKELIALCNIYLDRLAFLKTIREVEELRKEFNEKRKALIANSFEVLAQNLADELKETIYTTKDMKIKEIAKRYLVLLDKVTSSLEVNQLKEAFHNELKILVARRLEPKKKEIMEKIETLNLKYKDDASWQEIALKYTEEIKNILDEATLKKVYDKFLLEVRIFQFQKVLKQFQADNPNSLQAKKIQEEYQERLKLVKGIIDVEREEKNFLREFKAFQKKEMKVKAQQAVFKKKAFKKYFTYLCEQSISNNPDSEVDAYQLLEEICFLIDGAESDKLDELLEVLGKIKFQNLDADRVNLGFVEPLIYINKTRRDIVILKSRTKEKALYNSLRDGNTVSITNSEFARNFLSLKAFFRRGVYVGNREVKLLNSRTKKEKMVNTFQEYIWYCDGIMLLAEETVNGLRFIFKRLALYNQDEELYEWWYSSATIRREAFGGAFANRDTTYNLVLEYLAEEFQKVFPLPEVRKPK